MIHTNTPNRKAPRACDSEGLPDTNASDFASHGPIQQAHDGKAIAAPDKAAILAALGILFTPDDVIELRAFPKGRKRTDAGYFDSAHWPDLAEHAAQLSNNGAAVYVTLNPVDPQLLGRYNNRIEVFAGATTADKQIVRRRWLLIDLDPARPAQTSASDTQLEAARTKAQAIYKHLKGIGWADPVVAKSGNGHHLLYAIDLPNDDDSTALLKGVLAALADQFDDAQIKVDRSVFNAVRICKLYGTVANKGDNTEAAPWRLSALMSTPARELVDLQSMVLSWRMKITGEVVEQRVQTQTSPCCLGGQRDWFTCPRCSKRVAVLSAPGRYCACRQCGGLGYATQKEGAGDRASTKADKLRKRLGWEAGILNGDGGKPKGMHWKTY